MKTFKLHLLISLMIFSILSVRADDNQPQGIDLGEYAFGIPVEQLNFNNQSPFTLSFWLNIKEFNHRELGTQFINIRNPNGNWIWCDFPYIHSTIGEAYDMYDNKLGDDMMTFYVFENIGSWFTYLKHIEEYKFYPGEWVHISFQYYITNKAQLFVYVNGKQTLKFESLYGDTFLMPRPAGSIIMIGGPAYNRSPLNAYIDKVQLYNKALSQAQVIKSMSAPLIRDASLLGYWDFEDGCMTDADGFMKADKGTIKATMYKILSNSYEESIGTEVQPFTFGMGVNPESVIQGVEENNITESKTKAFVQNKILNIENTEGIDSVVVYDAMGKVITSTNANGATSTQITLPSNTKGVLIIKVNDEVIKVICD